MFQENNGCNKDEEDSDDVDSMIEIKEGNNLSYSDDDQRSKSETNLMPQLDGNVSESSEDEFKIIKSLFSVKCETYEIIQVLTFFRGFDFIWRKRAKEFKID